MSLSPNILLKQILAYIQLATGFYKTALKNHAANGESVILMYHRVTSTPYPTKYVEPGMYVTPATFNMQLEIIMKFFKVVSLNELIFSLNNKYNKPVCVITFDDGWYDFYLNAYPMLKRKKLPATIFLTTGFIGTNRLFWTDRIANIIKETHTKSKSNDDKSNDLIFKIEHLKGSQFTRIDRAINLLKQLSQKQIIDVIDKLEKKYCNKSDVNKRVFLNWDECREMKKSGLITFGSHTEQHIILTAENEDLCKKELIISKNRLIEEMLIDKTFIPFCYPNGNFSEKTVTLVKDASYNCAVTTKTGWINQKTDCFKYNRICMHQDMTSSPIMTLARILGKNIKLR